MNGVAELEKNPAIYVWKGFRTNSEKNHKTLYNAICSLCVLYIYLLIAIASVVDPDPVGNETFLPG